MIRSSYAKGLLAVSTVIGAVLGFAGAAFATTDPVTDGFTTAQTNLTGYIATGVGVIVAVLLLGIGVAVLVKYVRKAARAA